MAFLLANEKETALLNHFKDLLPFIIQVINILSHNICAVYQYDEKKLHNVRGINQNQKRKSNDMQINV